MGMDVLNTMQRLNIVPEERTVEMFLRTMQKIKSEHPFFVRDLFSFAQGLVLAAARLSDDVRTAPRPAYSPNLMLQLDRLERTLLFCKPQVSSQYFGVRGSLGRSHRCNWDEIGATRARND